MRCRAEEADDRLGGTRLIDSRGILPFGLAPRRAPAALTPPAPPAYDARPATASARSGCAAASSWVLGCNARTPAPGRRHLERATMQTPAAHGLPRRRRPYAPISTVKRVVLRRQQPPVRPAGGVLSMRIYCDSFLRNLRVMRCRIVQVECELFSFFASFFLFSKEKKKRNSL